MAIENFFKGLNKTEILDSILNSSTEYAIIATDMNDRIILWNKGAELIYGYTSEEMIGNMTPMSLHTNDTMDNNILFLSENTFRSNVLDYQMRALRKDGSTVPVSITVTPRLNRNKKTVGYLIISRDITKIKVQDQFRNVLLEISYIINASSNIDEMCSSSLKIISKFLDIPAIYICMFDKYNNSYYINSQVGLNEGYKKHSCNLSNDENLLQEDKNGCFETAFELTINSDTLSRHSICPCLSEQNFDKDSMSIIHIPLLSDVLLLGILHIIVPTSKKEFLLNETQVLSLVANQISGGIQKKHLEEENTQYANNLEKMVKTRTDELRQKDAQLVQSGKLATLGEMATGIAHEINQPLGGISLITQGLLMAKDRGKLDDIMFYEKLNSILEQIERINKIIAHLRTFARQSGETKQKVNIFNPLRDVFKLIGQQLINHGISIEMNAPENLPAVFADHNMLEQVFLNIIGNARDALEEYEAKTIEPAKSSEPDTQPRNRSRQITIRAYSDNKNVNIEISDNAGGIPKSIINKIFDPFFTTKDVGKGTGLGLSISYGIIKEFGGYIDVESEENKGSRFTIRLPIYKE